MKQIKEWEAVVLINGKYERAIPLPGCYISGTIDEKKVLIETSIIDLSKLIIKDIRGELLLSRWCEAFLFRSSRRVYTIIKGK